MAYNENIGRAIAKFDKAVRKAGFLFDAERKILSILRSMEYQVELGDYPPISVIQHLQAAIQSWIDAYGQDHNPQTFNNNYPINLIGLETLLYQHNSKPVIIDCQLMFMQVLLNSACQN